MADASGPVTVVDTHAHLTPIGLFDRVRSGEFRDVLIEETADGIILRAGDDRLGPVRQPMTDVTGRLNWMDAHGIEVQWVSPWLDLLTWHRFPESEARAWTSAVNQCLNAAVGGGGGRLRHVVAVHLGSGPSAAAEVSAWAEDAVAVIVNTHPAEATSLSDPSLDPFWAAVDERRLPVVLHPPADGPSCALMEPVLWNVSGRLIDTTAAVLDLMVNGVLERFPELRLVVVHGGGLLPYQAFRLDGLERAGLLSRTQLSASPSVAMRRLYYDTVALDATSIDFLVRRVGADRVLLGSDAPFPIGDPDPVGTLAAAGLAEADLRAIRGLNAASLDAR